MEEKKKKLLIIIAIVLFLIIAGGAVYYFFLRDKEEIVNDGENNNGYSETIGTSVIWKVEEGSSLYLVTDITLSSALEEGEMIETTFELYDESDNVIETYTGNSKYYKTTEDKELHFAYALFGQDASTLSNIYYVKATTEKIAQVQTPVYDYQFETYTDYTLLDESSEYNTIYRIKLGLPEEFKTKSGILVLRGEIEDTIKYISYLEDQDFIGATFINDDTFDPAEQFSKIDAYRLGNVVRNN